MIDWALTGKIIWCVCIILWAAIRWTPNRRSRRMKIEHRVRTPKERFSMAVSSAGLGIVPAIWVFTGLPMQADHSAQPWAVIVGLLLFFASLRLFRVTHKALGAMWSHSLDLREEHKLITAGIYEKVRHPMYSAFWLWAVAQTFLLSNWVAGFAGIIGFGTLYFLRVGDEEKMMLAEFGAEYETYMARTKRIIPFIH